MDNWKSIWSKKAVINNNRVAVLDQLITANGFDTGCGAYTADQWRVMVRGLVEFLNITEKCDVLEVGCGAGAFLYGIQLYSGANIFSYDYSSSLINSANDILVGDFRVSEATINPFLNIKFDFSISHSVFQYFPSVNYSYNVILEMSNSLKSGGKIALLDINDATTESVYNDERRRNYQNPIEYDEKYENHPHLFFFENDIKRYLTELGFCDIAHPPHFAPQYKNGEYRFNIVATKL